MLAQGQGRATLCRRHPHGRRRRSTRAAADRIRRLLDEHGVAISGLGYYPNPLAPDPAEAQVDVDHLKAVIRASQLLGVGKVNTFVGRDWTKTVDAQWPRFLETWRPLVAYAEQHEVRIGIENCPMLFTGDEWPGGKNLATSPAIWRRMFADIPSPSFGLNFDPSHFVWQHMDYLKPLREFRERIFHIHAKDVRIDRERLDDVGILATPLEFHRPKLPGLGEVNWGRFFKASSWSMMATGLRKKLASPTASRISMLAPSRVPMVMAPFIISFMLPVPEASLPAAVEICSDKSTPGQIFSIAETR